MEREEMTLERSQGQVIIPYLTIKERESLL